MLNWYQVFGAITKLQTSQYFGLTGRTLAGTEVAKFTCKRAVLS